jgi:MFS transporter, PAT family, beta-lactamase induction signal transducer AmpG
MQTNTATATTKTPWSWIPTLYFGQGLPYFFVTAVSVVMYKNLGLSNTEIAFFSGWLGLPWVIKPLWSPLVDMFQTKRFWIVGFQSVTAVTLALVAFTIPTTYFFQITLAIFMLMAFSSATHDIAADGFYMLGLKQHEQAAYVGIRSTFFRLAKLAAEGGVVYAAGELSKQTESFTMAWAIIFVALALFFALLATYHFFILPRPAGDFAVRTQGKVGGSEFWITFKTFFMRKDIFLVLAFLLTFRLGEAQALAVVKFFILDPATKGGLGLTTSQLGLVYGTYGVIALTIGGIIGGYAISRGGLKKLLWPMIFAVHIPNIAFVYLAYEMPTDPIVVTIAIGIEQFGYGFGFAAYLLFMIMVADGKHKTAHYSICTGFMALGMMLPGMASGWIQTQLGYQHFFIWVCICTLPSIVVALFLKIDPAFGKKKEEVKP